MKKVLWICALFGTLISADEHTLGLYCSDEQVGISISEDSYVQSSVNWAACLNKSTIKFNKKTKTYSVWTTFLATNKNVNMINSNAGYMRVLKEFNPKTKQVRAIEANIYSCNGTYMTSFDIEPWYNIVPNSLDEEILTAMLSK